jgi:hypothetical protein
VGARLVFNMHYHASVTEPQVDAGTGLALRWSTTEPEYIASFQLLGAPGAGTSTTGEFRIPAGEQDHQEILEFQLPEIAGVPLKVWSITNHMHKVGVDMKTSIIRDGEEICMVQTPNWDFDWQRAYAYDAPLDQLFAAQGGDIVRVRCTYDNSLENPSVVKALSEVGLEEPQDVFLGETTLDEMCLAGVGIALPAILVP